MHMPTFFFVSSFLLLFYFKVHHKPSRNLWSSSQLNLVCTSVSTLSYGHHYFCKASAELWNILLLNVKLLTNSKLNCL